MTIQSVQLSDVVWINIGTGPFTATPENGTIAFYVGATAPASLNAGLATQRGGSFVAGYGDIVWALVLPGSPSGRCVIVSGGNFAANNVWMPITDRPGNLSGTAVTTPQQINVIKSAAYRGVTTRTRHRCLFATTQIKLVFGNWTVDNSGTETANRNSVEWRACVQKMGSSVTDLTPARIPVTFNNGLQFGTCQPDGLLVSDPISLELDDNEFFFVTTYCGAAGPTYFVPGASFTQGGTLPGSLNSGEGYLADDGVLAGSVTFGIAQSWPGPLMVLGYTARQKPTPVIIGDSIVNGEGDPAHYLGYGGYASRLMTNQTGLAVTATSAVAQVPNFAHLIMARGSATAAAFASRINSYKEMKLAEYATTIMWQYGINDLGNTTASLLALQANLLAVARWFMARGKKFLACTLLPHTTSTDNFATTTNQTLSTGTEANRQAYNSWLRDPSVNGFVSWASGLSGPAWLANNSYPTIGAICNPVTPGVYQLQSPGVSAASGTGPYGTQAGGLNTNIVDGTCIWKLMPPITGLCDFLDAAAAVECNAAGVLTLNGGYWLPNYSNNDYAGTITAVSSSSIFTDANNPNAQDQHKGYSLRFTSGVNAVTTSAQQSILSEGAGGAYTMMHSQSVAAPSVGDAYVLFRPYTYDGLHPSSFGAMTIANALNTPANLAKFI